MNKCTNYRDLEVAVFIEVETVISDLHALPGTEQGGLFQWGVRTRVLLRRHVVVQARYGRRG